MKGNIRNFFPGGNTSLGFYSFYDYIISQDTATRKICIKGGPGTGKSSLMKKIGTFFNDKGYDVEYHHCSSDNNSLDGVVIKGLDVAILDGTSPHVVDPQNPGAVDEILNMGQHWNEDGFKKYREDIIKTNKQIKGRFQRAYKFIGASKLIHDDWSNYNKTALDRSKLAVLQEDLKNKILSNYEIASIGAERHLFATAFTPNGIVTFIDSLYESSEKVYVLNGGPGTGKTQILKFILEEAIKRGFFVEVYHDPLIPERIEHIIIPNLKTALVTSNEINQKKFIGTQIFMDNLLDYALVDKDEVQKDKDIFYKLLNEGLTVIASAKKLHDDLEKYYIENMNFEEIDEAYDKLVNRLLKYEKEHEINKTI
ncbi:PRK06851 family protein [Clostridium sp. A1-XYC3]|uniref:PRK06851 family protein n=1 Tax=Clostridium tanneri TaxID=3037988 RepID=A0ABU4JPI0_9CLOT|nr:PRK06851 family protein [Clostridium sp. A1-XYC3]MDW8800051.1 PRK06851 family protein [Clostridium sp. A1-XYC3]